MCSPVSVVVIKSLKTNKGHNLDTDTDTMKIKNSAVNIKIFPVSFVEQHQFFYTLTHFFAQQLLMYSQFVRLSFDKFETFSRK